MKMATVTEHTNFFAALTPQKYEISGLQRLQGRLFKITSPAGRCYRERDGEEAKLILDSVKWEGSAHQAACSMALLKAI